VAHLIGPDLYWHSCDIPWGQETNHKAALAPCAKAALAPCYQFAAHTKGSSVSEN
jgi:hypothetical protein